MAGVKVRFKMIIGFTCSTRQRLVNSETTIQKLECCPFTLCTLLVTQARLKRVDVMHAQQCPDNGTINANVVS
uniref:Uncharacterized protein n=1 Tax=Glossina palpalis gambiensis TaxID=67801 RepID=A0A1B0ALQ5_9MUSC